MDSLLYIRLIGLTAGTLVQLFWMVVILGYRRQRNFERVFFFLCLALFLFYSGSLLALNAQIHYGQPPVGLREFVIAIISVGLLLVPALLMHLHVEFAETRGMIRQKRWKWAVLFLFYAACSHLAIQFLPNVTGRFQFCAARRFPERGIRAHVLLQLAVVCGMAIPFLTECAEPAGDGDSTVRCSAIFLLAFALDCGLARVSPAALGCRPRRIGRCADDPAGGSAGGADLPRLAAQFSANWQAEESDLCGLGHVPGAAVPQPGASSQRVAGAGSAAGGIGVDLAVCARDFHRAAAARCWAAACRKPLIAKWTAFNA